MSESPEAYCNFKFIKLIVSQINHLFVLSDAWLNICWPFFLLNLNSNQNMLRFQNWLSHQFLQTPQISYSSKVRNNHKGRLYQDEILKTPFFLSFWCQIQNEIQTREILSKGYTDHSWLDSRSMPTPPAHSSKVPFELWIPHSHTHKDSTCNLPPSSQKDCLEMKKVPCTPCIELESH